MKKRGQHVPQSEQAVREQAQVDRILRSVEAAEHYLYLKKKFGPRS
jgi:hypothetical protein